MPIGHASARSRCSAMHRLLYPSNSANSVAGLKSNDAVPELPPRDLSGLQGLSGKMEPIAFPPPPPPPKEEKRTSLPAASAPPPAPVTRKLTSPFSWLSRGSSNKKAESPPATSERRNTNASVATLSSIPDAEGGAGNRTSQGSLRDRFKLLRMREEAGISMEEEPGLEAAIISEEKDEHSSGLASGPTSPRGSIAKQAPTVDPALAPGTASGIAAGPAAGDTEPVDWDLWQSVVNEGPAAVARTSPEELSRAISNGIPQAIRGVIWQVLAQSKNEELESLYKELCARGTDKEHVVKSPPTPNGNANGNGKDYVTSSSSSVHSNSSTSTSVALPSPAITNGNPDDLIRQHAKTAAEKRQSDAAIAKLEKTIRRDMGARTSYSKYLMAAGLQEGLFGVCKAYSLFDEAVGYAQGMNFIAMPLLFHVSSHECHQGKANYIRCLRRKHSLSLSPS